MTRGRILATEGGILLLLGIRNLVIGRLFAAGILMTLAALALVCAWALWPATNSGRI